MRSDRTLGRPSGRVRGGRTTPGASADGADDHRTCADRCAHDGCAHGRRLGRETVSEPPDMHIGACVPADGAPGSAPRLRPIVCGCHDSDHPGEPASERDIRIGLRQSEESWHLATVDARPVPDYALARRRWPPIARTITLEHQRGFLGNEPRKLPPFGLTLAREAPVVPVTHPSGAISGLITPKG